MEFSKENIVSKHFSKKTLGGLNEFEVRDFLYVLAEEIQQLSRENIQQKKQIQDQQQTIEDYRDREHLLKESINSAEKWAQNLRKEAEKNRSLILEKAQEKSEGLIQEARHSLQSVYSDIADLKRLHLHFKTGLKAALQVQMDLLDQDVLFKGKNPLSTEDTEGLLDQKNKSNESKEVSKEEDPLRAEAGELKKDLENKENPDPKELDSLRESLKNLGQSFS